MHSLRCRQLAPLLGHRMLLEDWHQEEGFEIEDSKERQLIDLGRPQVLFVYDPICHVTGLYISVQCQ